MCKERIKLQCYKVFAVDIGKRRGRTAKQLIPKEDGTSGFDTLWEMVRLDLSVEAHVLKPEYIELFTEEERKMCKSKLEQSGYKI